MKNCKLLLLIPVFLIFSCSDKKNTNTDLVSAQTADTGVTQETKALMLNLLRYQDSSLIFGHQDALAYGIGWWGGEFNSDVQKLTGKFPAVFGWDAGEIGTERNIDGVLFTDMQKWMIKVHEKGGINTLSWHLDNPVSSGDAWDLTPAVYAIIPGGELHEQFKETLDNLATFIEGLKTDQGVMVPIIFRPWHELNGSWFWWGRDHCSINEFQLLFKFTVEYLRDVKGLHNILYSYSTDKFASEEEYLERWPGDDFVDLIGYDDYHNFAQKETVEKGINSLRILARLGQLKNKPFALTETGLEMIPVEDWWTENILKEIKSDSMARKASYFLVWRNGRPDHYYAPYPGQLSADDFIQFERDTFTWFLEDLPNMFE